MALQALYSAFTATATHTLTNNCAAPSSLSACIRQTTAARCLHAADILVHQDAYLAMHPLIHCHQSSTGLPCDAHTDAQALASAYNTLWHQRVGTWCRIDETGAAEANSSQGLRQRGQRQPEARLSQAAQAKLKMHGNLQVSHDHVRVAANDIHPCLTVSHRIYKDAGQSQQWPGGCQ